MESLDIYNRLVFVPLPKTRVRNVPKSQVIVFNCLSLDLIYGQTDNIYICPGKFAITAIHLSTKVQTNAQYTQPLDAHSQTGKHVKSTTPTPTKFNELLHQLFSVHIQHYLHDGNRVLLTKYYTVG